MKDFINSLSVKLAFDKQLNIYVFNRETKEIIFRVDPLYKVMYINHSILELYDIGYIRSFLRYYNLGGMDIFPCDGYDRLEDVDVIDSVFFNNISDKVHYMKLNDGVCSFFFDAQGEWVFDFDYSELRILEEYYSEDIKKMIVPVFGNRRVFKFNNTLEVDDVKVII